MTQPANKKNRRRKIVLAIGVLLVAFVVAASGSTRRIRTEIEIDQSAEAVWAGGRQPGWGCYNRGTIVPTVCTTLT